MDYVLVEKRDLGRLVDVHIARGAGGGVSDHFLVVAKVKGGVEFRRRKKQVQCREVIKVIELSKRGNEQEYAEKERKAYERIEQQEIRSVKEERKVFRDTVLKCSTKVCGCRRVGKGKEREARGGMTR